MADLRASLRLPFREQIAAFRLRLGDLVPTRKWDDIQRSAHDRAFMVAGAMKADLLADLAAAVDRAVAEGTGLEAFRQDFRDIVERRGWHNWTGEATAAGRAWRTRVIYRTNMATTYAAGRMAQLVEAGYPLWIYRHGGSREPRVLHLGWDGLVLPADHPFWTTHAPPNGWGCSCYIVGARSRDAARRLGGDPDKGLPEDWRNIDPRTGAPKGIDKGWDYAPGASVEHDIRTMAEKSVDWTYSLAVAFMRSLPEQTRDALARSYRNLPSARDKLRRWAAAIREGEPGGDVPAQTLGLATTAQLQRIERLLGQRLAPDLYDFVVENHRVRHIWARHGDDAVERTRGQRALTPADFASLLSLVNAPDEMEVIKDDRHNGPVLRLSRVIGGERLVALFELRTRRRRLGLITFWVERNAETSPASTP